MRLGEGVPRFSGDPGGGVVLPTLLDALTPVDPFFSGEAEGMDMGLDAEPLLACLDAVLEAGVGIGGRPPFPSPFKILRVSCSRW